MNPCVPVPAPSPRGSTPPDGVEYAYPPHAGAIFLAIWALGFLVILAWWHWREQGK